VEFVADLKSFSDLICVHCEARCERPTHKPNNVCCVRVLCARALDCALFRGMGVHGGIRC